MGKTLQKIDQIDKQLQKMIKTGFDCKYLLECFRIWYIGLQLTLVKELAQCTIENARV